MVKKFELGGKADRVWKFRGMSVRICSERRLLVEFGRKPTANKKKIIAGFLLAASVGMLLIWHSPVTEHLPAITSTWIPSIG